MTPQQTMHIAHGRNTALHNRLFSLLTLAGLILLLAPAAIRVSAQPPTPGASAGSADGLVRVALIRTGLDGSDRCFSGAFLRLVGFETQINIDPALARITIESDQLFEHPFVILTGEGSFELTEAEVLRLRDYLRRGGMLLASAGCSNAEWNTSMRRTIERIFPEQDLARFGPEHEVFNLLFPVSGLLTRQQTEAVLWGVELDGRLSLVYSPEGLNDSESAGGDCCCCGGNEIRDARFINANLLLYALMG
ncbi:MAG: DUF4159 domain-containing protein [Phycisphaeraceae bacterium]|nr:MAG: DUF4159 domain-containing protein [Phycisphaeraceae bacterium]